VATAANTNASSSSSSSTNNNNNKKKKKGQRRAANGDGKHVAFSDGTRPGYSAQASGTRTRAAGAAATTTTTTTIARPAPSASQSGRLTRGQLNTTILFFVSISRLILLFNSISSYREKQKEEETFAADASIMMITPSETCIHYLGNAVCQSEAVQALLRLKFASSLECLILVFGVLGLSWSHEGHLQRVQAFMILSPLATTFFVLYYSNLYHHPADEDGDGAPVLVNGLFQECIMCVVLTALVAPYDDSIFIGTLNTTRVPRQARLMSRRSLVRPKTLQSLVLLTLYLFHLVEAARQVGLFLQAAYERRTNTTGTEDATSTTLTWTMSLLQKYYFDPVSTGMQQNDTAQAAIAACSLIVQFLLVDSLCRAIVYAYAWYAMEETYQRSLLLIAAGLAALDYGFTIPTVQAFVNASSSSSSLLLRPDFLEGKRTTALTMGCFAALGWIAPRISWKPPAPSSSSPRSVVTPVKES